MWAFECEACGRPGRRVCATCAGSGPLLTGPPPELIRTALAASRYDDPLGDVVRRVKGTNDRQLAVRLCRAMARRVWHDADALAVLHAADCITWAPSAWTRRATRGFSLGALLATEIGSLTPTPVVRTLAVRPGRRQAATGRKARRTNLRGRVRSTGPVAGRVVLVDDVMTTGTTATACARELLGAGAWRIDALVVSRVQIS